MVSAMAVRLMTIHVRNAALKKVGEFTAGAYSVTFREALNAPGGWVLSAPADHPSLAALLEPGAGLVIVTDEGDQFGGYVSPAGAGAKNTRTITTDRDTVTVYGVSEITPLWWRLILPPSGSTHDTVEGQAASAVPLMVDRHLGASASAARGLTGWQITGRAAGGNAQVSGRYSNLGDECSTHMGSGLWMRAVWEQEKIMFSVEDITATAIPISVDAGSAIHVTESANGTLKSTVYGLGSGVGVDRLVVEASTPVIPQSRIEDVHDDTGETSVPALAATTAALIEPGGTSLQAELVAGLTVRVGDSVRLYDSAGNLETVNVAETLTTITPDETVRLVTVGQPQTLGLDRLINQLDRNTSTIS